MEFLEKRYLLRSGISGGYGAATIVRSMYVSISWDFRFPCCSSLPLLVKDTIRVSFISMGGIWALFPWVRCIFTVLETPFLFPYGALAAPWSWGGSSGWVSKLLDSSRFLRMPPPLPHNVAPRDLAHLGNFLIVWGVFLFSGYPFRPKIKSAGPSSCYFWGIWYFLPCNYVPPKGADRAPQER